MRQSWLFPRAVRLYLACGLVALAVFYLLPQGFFKDTVFYPLFGVTSAAAIVAGTIWHRPQHRTPWLLFAAAQFFFAIGDVLFGVYEHVLHSDAFPSPADGFYLAGYPVLAAGLWLLVRQRSSVRDWGSLIDAAIVTVALGVVAWELLMVPYTRDASLSLAQKVTSIAYPLGDVLLLAVAVRLLLGNRDRTVSYLLIALSLVCLLIGDPLYTLLSIEGAYGSGNPIDSTWILSYLFWGAAALHPSMRLVSEPEPETAPKLTPLRLTLLGAASLTAPAVLAYRPERVGVACSAALFVLVGTRMSGIVAQHERAVAREARLRAAAATLVAATSDEEIHRAAVETAVEFAGGASARATLSLETSKGVVAVAAAGETAGEPAVEAAAAFPLVVRGEWRGVLEVWAVGGVEREDRHALETLAAQVALALETVARAREQAERRSEARFRSLVQNSADVIAIVAPDTTIQYLTPSVEGTLGYAAEEVDGKRFTDFVHPDDAERALEACAEAVASGAHSGVELRLRHADGRWLHTETVLSSGLEDDTIGGLVLTTRDVTVRKQFEAAEAERERVRDVFSRFVPEAVVEQLLAKTGGSMLLGGDTLDGTIMFTDLRSFTTFSESRPAQDVIAVVNRFLSEQTDAIMGHGGTIIAYLGDGIMAAFGAPIEQEDHADRALAASRELISERLPGLNDWMRAHGYGEGFRMGIGLNSGPFISGNVGHERRLEYTAIGDVCNTASRIQELTKGTRHMLLFSNATLAVLASAPDDLVDVGDSAIRGRHAAARLWSLETISDADVDL